MTTHVVTHSGRRLDAGPLFNVTCMRRTGAGSPRGADATERQNNAEGGNDEQILSCPLFIYR